MKQEVKKEKHEKINYQKNIKNRAKEKLKEEKWNHKKDLELIKKENENLKSNYSDIKGNTNNGNINNGTISNSSSNINNGIIGNGNTINIVQFGKEDLSHISNNDYKQYIKDMYTGLINLIKHVHCSKDKPQNYNVYLTNFKGKYIKIFKILA